MNWTKVQFMTTTTTFMAQFYVFTMPGDSCPIWVEGFDELGHWVAPSPFFDVETALTELDQLHPGAMIDSLCDEDEIADARNLARSGSGIIR